MILFPYERQGASSGLVAAEKLAHDLPLTWSYLLANRAFLEGRERGLMRGPEWYAYGRSQALDVMPLPKLFTPDLAPQAAFSWDPTGECFFTGGVAGGYGLLPSENYEPEYLLGLLNSRLLDWLVKQTATSMRGGWYSFESRFIRDLPIAVLGDPRAVEASAHDGVVGHVRQLLALSEGLRTARTAQEVARIKREFEAVDSRLDRLVYDLYGLDEADVALVEGSLHEL